MHWIISLKDENKQCPKNLWKVYQSHTDSAPKYVELRGERGIEDNEGYFFD